jgi:hypothetical protein
MDYNRRNLEAAERPVERKELPGKREKRRGPRLGSRAPKVAFLRTCSRRLQAHGVIHPSFPLRGRWERPVPSDKWAPSSPRTSRCGSCRNATHTRPYASGMPKLRRHRDIPAAHFQRLNRSAGLEFSPLEPVWNQFGNHCPESAWAALSGAKMTIPLRLALATRCSARTHAA